MHKHEQFTSATSNAARQTDKNKHDLTDFEEPKQTTPSSASSKLLHKDLLIWHQRLLCKGFEFGIAPLTPSSDKICRSTDLSTTVEATGKSTFIFAHASRTAVINRRQSCGKSRPMVPKRNDSPC